MSYMFAGVELGQTKTLSTKGSGSSVVAEKPSKDVVNYQTLLTKLGVFAGAADGLLSSVQGARNDIRAKFSMAPAQVGEPLSQVDYTLAAKLQDMMTAPTKEVKPVQASALLNNTPARQPPSATRGRTEAPPPADDVIVVTPGFDLAAEEARIAAEHARAAAALAADAIPGWVLPVAGAAAFWFFFLHKK